MTVAAICVMAMMLVTVAQARPPASQDCTQSSSVKCHPAPTCPQFDHVVILVMENNAYQYLNNATLFPNIVGVQEKYSKATQYYGFTHDSLPNYLSFAAGTNNCAHDDGYQIFNISSVFEQLDNSKAKLSNPWKCYSEDLPYDGYSLDPGNDLGIYGYRHNPCALFSYTKQSKFASRNTNGAKFWQDVASDSLPLLSFYIPNTCNDMHGDASCPGGDPGTFAQDALAAIGDQFVGDWFARMTSSKMWKTKKVLVVFTYDENDYSGTEGCCGSPMNPAGWKAGSAANCTWEPIPNSCTATTNCPQKMYQGYTVTDQTYGGGKTVTAFAYSQAKGRCELNYPMNHISVLKTLEHCWNLPFLGVAGQDNVPYIDGCVFN